MSKVIGRNLLTNRHFVLTPNTAGVDTTIAERRIPREIAEQIVDDAIEMRLMTRETFTFTTAAGETTRMLSLAGDIVSSPELGHIGDSAILIRTTPAPIIEWTTATIDYVLNRITLTGLLASTAYVFDVFYVFGEGNFTIKLETPTAGRETSMLYGSVRSLSQRSQYNVKSALTLSGELMPEMFRLVITLNSPRVVSWDANARNSILSFPIAVQPMHELPEEIVEQVKAQMVG